MEKLGLKDGGTAQTAMARGRHTRGWAFRERALAIAVVLGTFGGLIALLYGSKQLESTESPVNSGLTSRLPIAELTGQLSRGEAQAGEAVEVGREIGREVGLKTTALLQGLANGGTASHVRQALIKDAAQIPLPFALAVEELVIKLQPNEQHMHKLFIGLLVDVAAETVELMTTDEQSEFFDVVHRIADLELEIPELVPVPEVADLPKDRFDDLMHHGEVVSNPEGFHLSTLPSKSMAVFLVGMDPDRNRSTEYLSGLSWRSRNTSPRGTAALRAISAQPLKAPQ